MPSVECSGQGLRKRIRLIDSDSGSSAIILPNYGFNCVSFICRVGSESFDFLYADEDFPSEGLKPSHHGTPILAPFPNRIRSGQFTYEGKSYQLPCNENGKNAIHGFVIDQPWRITGQGTHPEHGAWVRGEFQLSRDNPDSAELWPADFRLSVTYQLCGQCLRTLFEIENPDEKLLPFGIGTHPYFRFPLGEMAELGSCQIHSPMTKQVELEECLPTGKLLDVDNDTDLRRRPALDQRTFDDVFCVPQKPGRHFLSVKHSLFDSRAKAGLMITHDPDFRYVVIYTPPHRKAVCIEPYTCVTDAINLEGSSLDTGLWHLRPGQKRELWIEYVVRSVED